MIYLIALGVYLVAGLLLLVVASTSDTAHKRIMDLPEWAFRLVLFLMAPWLILAMLPEQRTVSNLKKLWAALTKGGPL